MYNGHRFLNIIYADKSIQLFFHFQIRKMGSILGAADVKYMCTVMALNK